MRFRGVCEISIIGKTHLLAAERHRKILTIVERNGSAKVTDLAEVFDVTQETIRRDLEKLESDGKLLRKRGGAITLSSTNREIPFAERQITNVQEKVAIATEAIRRIEAKDTIILDSSTTAWQIARLLPDMPLTVITHSIKVVAELAQRPQVTCLCLGGNLSTESLSFIGPMSERNLQDYHADKLFLSCKGFHLSRGCSESSEWQALLKQRMLEVSNKHYLLADHSKYGVKALSVFSEINEYDELISDSGLDPQDVRDLERQGIVVTLVDAE